jgi:ubiquinone/menaquinone biosynthesis C-methylase UbiE
VGMRGPPILDRLAPGEYIAYRRIRLMRKLLSFFFHLLYHQFSWMYDLVAAAVSLGRWQAWVVQARPFLNGRVLEIGFGPGHLQMALNADGLAAFGLDESCQMSRQAGRRLRRRKYPLRLAQGCAQYLPFPGNSFDRVVATFPSDYIFEAQTLAGIRRVLRPAGELIILPSAWITGNGLMDRLAAGLFQATGQAGRIELILPGMKRRLTDSGFAVRHELVELEGSRVLVLIASKFF